LALQHNVSYQDVNGSSISPKSKYGSTWLRWLRV